MSAPTIALLKSVLKTKHAAGPRAGKYVETYCGLAVEGYIDGVPVLRIVTKWHEEDPGGAFAKARKAVGS